MSDYEPGTYGDRIAEAYDDLHAWHLDTDTALEGLAALAGPGPVLELGVGTGRLAIPLADRGLEVHGIDASEAMVAKLRAKPGGDRIEVAIGDFADVPAPGGPYTMVFAAFNTIFALQSQGEQIRCFQEAGRALAGDGVLVVEAFFPDVSRFSRGQLVEARKVETDRIELEVSNHDPIGQRVVSEHVIVEGGRITTYPVHIRYAWPSELDLMARLAGLRLRDRWGGWRGEPFTTESTRHVSVYRRA